MTVPKQVQTAIEKFTEEHGYGSIELCFQNGEITMVKTNRITKLPNSKEGQTHAYRSNR
jgi:hypothetical protein